MALDGSICAINPFLCICQTAQTRLAMCLGLGTRKMIQNCTKRKSTNYETPDPPPQRPFNWFKILRSVIQWMWAKQQEGACVEPACGVTPSAGMASQRWIGRALRCSVTYTFSVFLFFLQAQPAKAIHIETTTAAWLIGRSVICFSIIVWF